MTRRNFRRLRDGVLAYVKWLTSERDCDERINRMVLAAVEQQLRSLPTAPAEES